jgi:hypothetical protein
MNTGRPEAFARVDVADAGETVLVEQGRLDRRGRLQRTPPVGVARGERVRARVPRPVEVGLGGVTELRSAEAGEATWGRRTATAPLPGPSGAR